jgi:RNA polymerase sigma factor
LLLLMFKKFLGGRAAHTANDIEPESPEDLVVRIQDGDIKLRNQFITDYQPYIAKVTSKVCKRYIHPAQDDEFSIALAAFNESINRYAPGSGPSFLSFAETVIRRRLIDYFRKEQRSSGQIPLSSFDIEDDEENVINPVDIHQSIEEYEKELTNEERRREIQSLHLQLTSFGISFSELVDASPKHADSRETLIQIAKLLADNMELMQRLQTKKTLPIKELLDLVEVSRKTLERNRKFIIAVALILEGNYPYLEDYLHIPAGAEGKE